MRTIYIITICYFSLTWAGYPSLGEPCTSSQDCRNDWEDCSPKGHCIHKNVFPMLDLDYIGSLFTLGSLIFANAGGIGGGGIMIPTCIAFFGMDTKNAIALSNVSIFFSGIIRYFFNRNKINPQKGFGVLVDYNYPLIMLPFNVIGSLIGVMLYVMFPNVFIVSMLTLCLAYIFVGTVMKQIKMFKME